MALQLSNDAWVGGQVLKLLNRTATLADIAFKYQQEVVIRCHTLCVPHLLEEGGSRTGGEWAKVVTTRLDLREGFKAACSQFEVVASFRHDRPAPRLTNEPLHGEVHRYSILISESSSGVRPSSC